MPVKKIHTDAFLVIDTFSYKTQITEYDPLVSNSMLTDGNLLSGEEYEEDSGVGVLSPDGDMFPVDAWEDEDGASESITPTNDELRRLAAMKTPPKEWLEGEEERPF